MVGPERTRTNSYSASQPSRRPSLVSKRQRARLAERVDVLRSEQLWNEREAVLLNVDGVPGHCGRASNYFGLDNLAEKVPQAIF